MEISPAERTLTELDHVRLLNLLNRLQRAAAHGASLSPRWHVIEDMLDASTLVPAREVAPDLVTMNAEVLLQDTRTAERSTLTLCYPEQADAARGRVSVLSPVGSALLGLRVGSVARWVGPSGHETAVEILALRYQPEAAGDFHL